MANQTKEAIKQILRRYPELPSHYITLLIGKPLHTKGGHRRINELVLLTQMTVEKTVHRFPPTNDKDVNVAKHYSYSIEEPGYKDRQKRPHRLLESVVQADTEIGARADTNYEYISFNDFLAEPDALPRSLLDVVDSGGDPHLIPLNDSHLHPDGAPFCILNNKTLAHVNYIDEIDRDTEPLSSTKKRRTIEEKFERYKEFYKDRVWQKHYGFKNCMVRWFTTSESRMHAMMRIAEPIVGPSAQYLFATTKDWINEISYARGNEIGETFRQKYLRIGKEPYWMNRV